MHASLARWCHRDSTHTLAYLPASVGRMQNLVLLVLRIYPLMEPRSSSLVFDQNQSNNFKLDSIKETCMYIWTGCARWRGSSLLVAIISPRQAWA